MYRSDVFQPHSYLGVVTHFIISRTTIFMCTLQWKRHTKTLKRLCNSIFHSKSQFTGIETTTSTPYIPNDIQMTFKGISCFSFILFFLFFSFFPLPFWWKLFPRNVFLLVACNVVGIWQFCNDSQQQNKNWGNLFCIAVLQRFD